MNTGKPSHSQVPFDIQIITLSPHLGGASSQISGVASTFKAFALGSWALTVLPCYTHVLLPEEEDISGDKISSVIQTVDSDTIGRAEYYLKLFLAILVWKGDNNPILAINCISDMEFSISIEDVNDLDLQLRDTFNMHELAKSIDRLNAHASPRSQGEVLSHKRKDFEQEIDEDIALLRLHWCKAVQKARLI